MLFDVTILQTVSVDDNKKQNIEIKALVNSDHLALIEPRTQGGSVLSFPGGAKMVVKETKGEIKTLLGLAPLAPVKEKKKK